MRDDGQDLATPGTERSGGRASPGPAPDGDVDAAAWLHGTWLVRLVDGVRPADGLQGPPWLVLEGDGVVFGYAGVNRVRGTWHLERDVLGFGPVVATRMAGPEPAAATERAVLGFLSGGGEVEPRGDRLVVHGADGRNVELERTVGPPDA